MDILGFSWENTVTIPLDLMFAGRILLSGVCGCAIGYERQQKQKMAGTKTHVIVAIASALMMIISKYGFYDVLGDSIKLDPSRVAAGLVTAIGFIGSGVIFVRNKAVSGVTTSAGIWATVGVGMAMGSGMYLIGVITTVMILLVEIFLGRKPGKVTKRISMELTEAGSDLSPIRKQVEELGLQVIGVSYGKKTEKGTVLQLTVEAAEDSDYLKLVETLKMNTSVIEIKI
jgi:putative Mg2+ transporter-C (MgtC) family protein